MLEFIVLGLLVVVSVLYVRELLRKGRLIKEARSDAVRRSRSSIEGQVLEQMVPYLPKWKYTPSDARFISSPLDFVVFDGLSKGKVKGVIFIEVKSGQSKETGRQKSVKKAIESGNVTYELLEIEGDEE